MATFVTFKPADSEKLSEDKPVLKYKLLTSKAYPPTRETAGSIGYDLRSPRFARIPPKGGTYYLTASFTPTANAESWAVEAFSLCMF